MTGIRDEGQTGRSGCGYNGVTWRILEVLELFSVLAIGVSLLAVILYCCFVRCYLWGNWVKVMWYLCVISYNSIGIYSYLKIKIKQKIRVKLVERKLRVVSLREFMKQHHSFLFFIQKNEFLCLKLKPVEGCFLNLVNWTISVSKKQVIYYITFISCLQVFFAFTTISFSKRIL